MLVYLFRPRDRPRIIESIKPGFLGEYSEQVALVRRDGRPSIEDGVGEDEEDDGGFAIGETDEEDGGGSKQNGWADSRTQNLPMRHNGHAGGYEAVYNDEQS